MHHLVKVFYSLILSARADYHGNHQYGINVTAFEGNAFANQSSPRRLSPLPPDVRKMILGNVAYFNEPMRVYMHRETSRITAYVGNGDGTFKTADLGFIRRPHFRSFDGKGKLCLWGADHVVFQSEFRKDAKFGKMPSTLHVKNIDSYESKKIPINFVSEDDWSPWGVRSPLIAMGGKLFVIGRKRINGPVLMMAFKSPDTMNNRFQSRKRIALPGRLGREMNPERAAYGVLKVDGVQTLIVTGMVTDKREELVQRKPKAMYCESYVMKSKTNKRKSGWTACGALPPNSPPTHFDDSIVWKNQLVARARRVLFVYSPTKRDWTQKKGPSLGGRTFLNAEDHLCIEGCIFIEVSGGQDWQVWCLADLEPETEWKKMPDTYVFKEYKNNQVGDRKYNLIGTLPAMIIRQMEEANKGQ